MDADTRPDTSSLPPLPRAPSQATWDAMTPEERKAAVDALPACIPLEYRAGPPEGDDHVDAAVGTRDTLRMLFERAGRRLYVGSGVSVFYPGEEMFAPDVIAVEEVDPHNRTRWVVSAEGKGVDLALEVLVLGDRKKDLERNVRRYAGHGIREYFIYDRTRRRLLGYRLPSPGARMYEPIVPQRGKLPSRVLGLDLVLEGGRLRFYRDTAKVLERDEIILMLEENVEASVIAREEEAELRAAAEARVTEAEAKRAEAEARLAEALAEIERLRGGR